MKSNTALWLVQGLLAAMFLLAGAPKLVSAIGLIAPGLTGIRPGLTPLASAGLVIIMVGASVINIMNGMAAFAIPTAVLGLMAAYVVYGRWWTASS
jgi:hypothetical protein